jgi:hypothetical protein
VGQGDSQDEEHETPVVPVPAVQRNDRRLVFGALMIGGGVVALVALLIVGAIALFNGGSTTASPFVNGGSTATLSPPTSTSPEPTALPTPQYALEIESFKCTPDASVGFAYVEGEVKNISTDSLSDVEAVGTWYTSAGTFIVSDDALTDFNPILPGQTSPFKTYSTYNPEMRKCDLKFKDLFGGQIPASGLAPTATPILSSQLVTASEIKSALGGDWTGDCNGGCRFTENNGQPFPELTAVINADSLGSSPEQEFYDRHAGAILHTSLDHVVSGLGDDAYWSQNDGLDVRKGNIDINVAVYPGLGGYRDEGKSIAVAKIVLANLGSPSPR